MQSEEVIVIKNIFNDELIERLIHVLPENIRKRRWDWSETTPWPQALNDARTEIFAKVSQVKKINTAILKRYSASDESTAYILHRDPEEFLSQPLVLVTLSGSAYMRIETIPEELLVSKGDCVILYDPSLQHAVSEPHGPSHTRHLLFFGYSSSHHLSDHTAV